MKKVFICAFCLTLATPCLLNAGEPTPKKRPLLSAVEISQGWQTLSSKATFSEWQPTHPYDLFGFWTFSEHTISLKPGAGDIHTANTYSDYELELEWKVEPGGESGIILNAAPGVSPAWKSGFRFQLADNTSPHITAENKELSGSCYQLIPAAEKVPYKAHQWNTARIVKKGEHFTFFLNGVKSADFQARSNTMKEAVKNSNSYQNLAAFGNFQAGYIVLEDRGSAVSFRNIKIRSTEAYISTPIKLQFLD